MLLVLGFKTIRPVKMEGLFFSIKLHPLPFKKWDWNEMLHNYQGEQCTWRSALFSLLKQS